MGAKKNPGQYDCYAKAEDVGIAFDALTPLEHIQLWCCSACGAAVALKAIHVEWHRRVVESAGQWQSD